jgi:predicted RNA-binding Zn-ribbon protein involved in translation (DUF1610 family)
MAQAWGTITFVGTPNPKIESGSGFTVVREKATNIKKPVLVCLAAFLALSSISRVATAQDDWKPNCAPGFSVMGGEKTVNLTNNSPQPETLAVSLMSASWDTTVKQWVGGKTYTLNLPAGRGEQASGHLSYVGCGKAGSYAVVFQIAIAGSDWLYKLTGNDPYAPGQVGNLNCGINVVSTEYDKYRSSFSNVGCAGEVQVKTADPQWSPEIKESDGTYFTCTGDTVMDGMQHQGDENKKTRYRCAALLPVGIEKKACEWAPPGGIKESAGDYACPGNKVMVGRQHYKDENGLTQYYCCDLSYNKTTPVNKESCEWSPVQKQSATSYSCPNGKVMTARNHTGDENGWTQYRCCGLTFDKTNQKLFAPK